MADLLGIGVGSGAPPNDGQLQLSPANLRALAGLLKPGEVVSGRVEQALGGDLYAFTVRGQTVVASSLMPLTADSVLRFQVLTSADGQLALRLMDLAPSDQAVTSDAAGRARQLGLPPGPAATAVIAAFEAAGAPLHGARVQAALVAVSAAAPEQVPRLAHALAVLARADLPVTNALLSLVMHAAPPTLPDVASAVLVVQRSLAAATVPTSPAAVPTSAQTPSPPVLASLLPVVAASAPVAAASTNAVPGPSQLPVASVIPPAVSVVPVQPSTSTVPSSASVLIPPAVIASPAFPARPAEASGPSGSVLIAGSAAATSASASAAPPSVAASPPGLSATSAPPPVVGQAAGQAAVHARAPMVGAPFSNGLPQSLPSAEIALRLLSHLRLPDAVEDGALGVQQSLALAGLRPKRSVGDESIRPPTLVRQLAEALPATTGETKSVSVRNEERPPIPAAVSEAIVGAVRENTAEAVFKPQALADYDHVLPLPLLAQGQPTPARLAVAERQTVAGVATFVRVDAELSRLGPVSVRLSGIEGGALTITLLAHDASGRVLAAGLPDLAESLRQLGVVAGLRVANLLSEDGHAG